jgi:tol-pal system protein YbgF
MHGIKICSIMGLLSAITLVRGVVVESKPLLSQKIVESVAIEQVSLQTEYKDHLVIEAQIKNLVDLSEQLINKVDYLKNKIDGLEKQQRDFLSLISDVVLQPEKPLASQEHRDYQTTLDLLKAQQYQQALKALQKFLTDYPQSEKIPYVYYWIAEVHLLDNRHDQAKECYSYLLSKFPLHQKAAEALFKIGQIDYNEGHYQEAKSRWLEVIERFPQSQVSYLAKKNLSKVDL